MTKPFKKHGCYTTQRESLKHEGSKPKKKFSGKESYTHLFAKQLLAQWLREGELNFQCGGFTTNVKPMKDIVTEYPIMDCFPYPPEEFGKSKWIAVADVAVKHKGIIPYVFEVVNKNEDIGDKMIYYSSKKEVVAFFIRAPHILGQIKRPSTLQAISISYYGKIIESGDF